MRIKITFCDLCGRQIDDLAMPPIEATISITDSASPGLKEQYDDLCFQCKDEIIRKFEDLRLRARTEADFKIDQRKIKS